MKCVICKTGEMKPGTTTLMFERGGSTIIVREVPSEVCDTCGERYVEEAITATLLQQADQAAQSGAELEIRRFVAA